MMPYPITHAMDSSASFFWSLDCRTMYFGRHEVLSSP